MNDLKICYLWVRKFRNLNDSGINFSSTDKFSFDLPSHKISTKKISPLPNNFFGKGITEVTGIIGMNGSGKSNILELVCKVLKRGNTTLSEEFLIIVETENGLVCYHNFLVNPQSINCTINFKLYESSIDPLKVVYFSNVYDQRITNFDKEVSDISSNKRFSKPNIHLHGKNKSDFEYQLNFIRSNLYKEIGVPSPERILITSNVWNKRFTSNQKLLIFGDYLEHYNRFESDLRKRLRGIKEKNRLFYLIVFAFFKETASNLRIINFKKGHNPSTILRSFFSTIQDHRSTEDLVNEIILWLLKLRPIIQVLQSISRKNPVVKLLNLLNIIDELRFVLFEIDTTFETEGRRSKLTELYSFNFHENQFDQILKILLILEKNTYFRVDWLGISSGHKAYLNLFSLIFAEVKRTKKPNLILCIDEGDLYLHPQWQLEFFSNLTLVLPKIYSGNIQLILTSHSPFLLSDIPKQCLTILDTSIEGGTINGEELLKETFAANIYDLYEAPFFLGNQKKSVFSTKKIKEIITLVENKNSTDDEIDKLISLIGDDVIRFHLEKRMRND